MAKNYIQPGETISVTANVSYNAGQFVQIGDLKGVALNDAAMTKPLDVATVGVWELLKIGANEFLVGTPVYNKGGVMTSDSESGANPYVGYAVEIANNTSSTVKVKLQ